MSDAPFKAGDRVRYCGKRRRKLRLGVVRRATPDEDDARSFWVCVSLDGGSLNYFWHRPGAPPSWGVVPPTDWTLDDLAQVLARAVLEKRDGTLVRMLNDRLTELFANGAT